MTPTIAARARLSAAQAAMELADHARRTVADTATPMTSGERVREARRARVLSMMVLSRTVLAERLAGATWGELADALGLTEQETVALYGPTEDQWADVIVYPGRPEFTVGLREDPDPEGTATAIDGWLERHRDPWDPEVQDPVARALHT